MRIKLVTLLSFFVVFCSTVYCQTAKLDSLLLEFKKNQTAQKQVDILNELSFCYFDINDSIGYEYAKKAYDLSSKIHYPKGLKYAATLVGFGAKCFGDYRLASLKYKESDQITLASERLNTLYNLSQWITLYIEQAKFDSAQMLLSRTRDLLGKNDHEAWVRYCRSQAIMSIKLWKNETALSYLDTAIIHQNEQVDPDEFRLLDLYMNYFYAYDQMSQRDKAMEYFAKITELSVHHQSPYFQIRMKHFQSVVDLAHGNFTEAFEIISRLAPDLKTYKYPPQFVDLLIRLAKIYELQAKYDVAIEHLQQALDVAGPLSFEFEIARIHWEMASIGNLQGNLKYAHDFVDQSQRLREKLGDLKGLADCLLLRGSILRHEGKNSGAIIELNKAQTLYNEIKDQQGQASVYFHLSLTYEAIHKKEEAKKMLMQAIKLREKGDDMIERGNYYNHMANLLTQDGKLNQALIYLKKAEDLAAKTKSKSVERQNAIYYSQYFERKKDFKSALFFRKKYEILDDSIYSNANVIQLVESKGVSELIKKNKDLELLRIKKEDAEIKSQLNEARLRFSNMTLTFTTIGFLLFGIASYALYRLNEEKKSKNQALEKKQEEILTREEELREANGLLAQANESLKEKNEEIEAQANKLGEANRAITEANQDLEQKVSSRTENLRQAYQELDTFFYRSSHDFRRPLTTFMGLVEVANLTIQDKNALELFGKMKETAEGLDKMLIKLQSISNLDSQQLFYKEFFVRSLVEDSLQQQSNVITEKNISTVIEIDPNLSIQTYYVLLKVIVDNVIENAIVFSTHENPWLKIEAKVTDSWIDLKISDNGQGIDPHYQDRIFQMYYRANQTSKGNGLGLYIAKKAVGKLGGSIGFSSKLYKGSEFTITLPISPTS